MSIEEQLNTKLKEGMRAKRAEEVSVIRMVKTQAARDRAAPGFDGETGDEFWLDVIGRYVKQLKKTLAEFEALGDAAAAQVEQTRFEIGYLSPFLPSLLPEREVSILVERAIADTGAVGAKMIGRVVGAVMKDHKDRVDPAMVKKIAALKLG